MQPHERESLFQDLDLTEDERRWLSRMPAWTTVRGENIEAKFDRLLSLCGTGDDLPDPVAYRGLGNGLELS